MKPSSIAASIVLRARGASARALPALVVALTLGACASTRMDAEWSDPQYANQSLRGTRVMIACDAAELAVQRNCQDRFTAQWRMLGAAVLQPPESTANTSDEQWLSIARAAGARALLRASVAPDAVVARPGPSIGLGLGGFGGGRVGVGVGTGVSVPVGAGSVNTAYAASSKLIDATSGKLIWTGKAIAPASDNINQQLDDLAATTAEAVKKAGVY